MSKYEGHTPGPWERAVDLTFTGIIIAENGNARICKLYGKDEVTEANAQLIADAWKLPKLLEQNQRMLAALKDCLCMTGDSVIDKLITEIEGSDAHTK